MDKNDQGMLGTQSLARALAVLDAVASGCSDQVAIAQSVGTTRSTTSRVVSFLQRSGFVRHVDGRGYILGARLIELGAAALAQLPLTSLARPFLQRISQQTGDTVHLSIRDDDQIMYVEKIPGTKGLEMRSRVGLRKPMAITGTGKAQMLDMTEKDWARLYSLAHAQIISEPVAPPGFLNWPEFLAAMRDYKARGYTLEVEENEISICCVAAPVRDARGDIVAGLSVASTTPYMSRARMESLAPLVVGCADDISRQLGYSRKRDWPSVP